VLDFRKKGIPFETLNLSEWDQGQFFFHNRSIIHSSGLAINTCPPCIMFVLAGGLFNTLTVTCVVFIIVIARELCLVST